MNCNVLNSNVSNVDCVLSNRASKKPTRRRRRNKSKNFISKVKKKNQKKFHKPNVIDSIRNYKFKKLQVSDTFEKFYNRKIMSSWYWSNYKKALEWQDKNKIAYWKSYALALLVENRYLIEIINSMQPGTCPESVDTMEDLSEKMNKCKKHMKEPFIKRSKEDNTTIHNDNEEKYDNEIDFEMSEEMIQFFEQSFKHKMDLQNFKEEKQFQNDEEEIIQIQSNRLKRTEEMHLLYGEEASMITGMETALQLSFDKYRDTKSPKYWPNIPLRL